MSNGGRTPAVPDRTRLRIRIIDFFGSPIVNADCQIVWDNITFNPPPTNLNGIIEVDVPLTASIGLLFVPISSGADMEIEIKLESYSYATTNKGRKARLTNLGYLPLSKAAGPVLDDTFGEEAKRAEERFKTTIRDHLKLARPDELDALTASLLEDAHDKENPQKVQKF